MSEFRSDPSLIAQRPDLLRLGIDDRAIARAKAAGALLPLRRGAYLRPVADPTTESRDHHALMVMATIPRLGDGAVVSHVSAAVLHGISVWPRPTMRVHVTKARLGGGRRTRTLYLHVAGLPDDDIVQLGGIQVSSAARTVLDIARTEAFETGVIVADQALARRLVTVDDLRAALARHRGRQGHQRAAAVLAFADGRSESVGESRSRVIIARTGLPAPQLQYEVRDTDGTFIARPDFAYVEEKIAGEFDGRQKYASGGFAGRSASDTIVTERRRSESLQRAGWAVVRWMWDELETPTVILAKFRAAFDAQSRAPSRARQSH